MRIQVGRWRVELRVELDVWRARSRPALRTVLWGARRGQRAFGGDADRLEQITGRFRDNLMAMFARKLMSEMHVDHVHVAGGFSVVPFEGIPADTLIVVDAGTAAPKGILSNIGGGESVGGSLPHAEARKVMRQMDEAHAMPERELSDAAKLAAYTDTRGWLPGEDAA